MIPGDPGDVWAWTDGTSEPVEAGVEREDRRRRVVALSERARPAVKSGRAPGDRT